MKVQLLKNPDQHIIQLLFNDNEIIKNKWIIYKELIVYGITLSKKKGYYLLSDKDLNSIFLPCEIFHITDKKLSCYWFFKKYKKNEKRRENHYIWGYYELVNCVNYLEDLHKYKIKGLKNFRKSKKEMDMEFPDWSLQLYASINDSKTLKCPICDTMWESNSIFAMVECPKCKNIMHNPNFS